MRLFGRGAITLSLLTMLLTAPAAEPEPSRARTGQGTEDAVPGSYTLQYGVEWRLVRAGMTRFTWTPQSTGYQADLQLESAGLVNKLYRVNDHYRALMGQEHCAKNVLFKTEEGKRRRETTVTFDAGKVHYLERDLVKNNIALQKELQTPACVYEYLGALHSLRGMKLEPGHSTTVPITDGKKFANVKVEAQEREQVKTPTGTYSTVRYEVFLFNDVIIPKKARFYVWLTDDERRLPVQLRARMAFLIGTITLQLEKEEYGPKPEARAIAETAAPATTSK